MSLWRKYWIPLVVTLLATISITTFILEKPSERTVHVRYTAPAWHPGGNISLSGFWDISSPSGILCADKNASATVFECDLTFPLDTRVLFWIGLPHAGAPGGFIWWGDMNWKTPTMGCPDCECSPWGGDGAMIGTLTLTSDDKPVTFTMVPSPAYNDPNPNRHCERGEMLIYNGSWSQ
ncbi:hypothetical protein A3E39_02745 [Candidatus Uhrbacteria bacterium RIFCSPHIGHO2_12_FULL_60_25]|uniref:Uncharacterized protein n=1 Tax=Candidatus Uhrbacteria bacterium RIFCSPHIGHO2_12_FULL_60_25 TaxID=1802399 RepID=A0A1F7UJH0_9BACT|nr:MAG: hypothetical protein A3D73_00010 [Candidatus Uhrbacteria bacterium RIFCSPHIGHO2_02_FULL_60_44]OGL78395.1 MAG: hypothetical protein A3E39_02745 [Candidatus Uhrbacteria bacterium RIFCSPHIGHO2_12_FULL_60_25]